LTYETEEQQVEQLKKLWKEYGWSTIIGIALAIAIVFGWRFYQSYRIQHAQKASLVYERMMMDVLNHQWSDATSQAQMLRQQFAHTPYAKLAAFTLAKQAVSNKKYDKASTQLQWVINHASDDSFKQIAQLRLARVDLELKQPHKALQTLKTIHSDAYAGVVNETRGDAYVQLGQLDKAKAAYELALTKMADDSPSRPVLQMKLADLPAS